MEEYKNCSYRGCSDLPTLLCLCKQNVQPYCLSHLQLHTQQEFDIEHKISTLWIQITQNQQNILKNKKKDLLNKKTQSIKNVLFQTSEELKRLFKQALFIQQKTQQIISKIEIQYNQQLEKVQNYLSSMKVLADDHHKTQFASLLKFSFNFKIPSIFNSQVVTEKSLQPSPQNPIKLNPSFIFFFKQNTKQFCKLDLINHKVSSKIVNISGNMGDDVMCWSDEKVLFFNGSNYSNSHFKIHVDTLQIYPTPSLPINSYSNGAVVKHKDSYFHFGGCDVTNASFKWDGKGQSWIRIADLPIGTQANSAVSVKDSILVTGHYLDSVYQYNENMNRFEKVLQLVPNTYKHLLLTSQGELICLCQSNGIFVCGKENLRNWRKVGVSSIHPLSRSVSGQYGEFIYYFNFNKKLVRVNKMNYIVETLGVNYS